jgi:hypothetical protein
MAVELTDSQIAHLVAEVKPLPDDFWEKIKKKVMKLEQTLTCGRPLGIATASLSGRVL